MWRGGEWTATYKPRREASEEPNPADALTSDCQPAELWESKFLLFKVPPSLWCFVVAALRTNAVCDVTNNGLPARRSFSELFIFFLTKFFRGKNELPFFVLCRKITFIRRQSRNLWSKRGNGDCFFPL